MNSCVYNICLFFSLTISISLFSNDIIKPDKLKDIISNNSLSTEYKKEYLKELKRLNLRVSEDVLHECLKISDSELVGDIVLTALSQGSFDEGFKRKLLNTAKQRNNDLKYALQLYRFLLRAPQPKNISEENYFDEYPEDVEFLKEARMFYRDLVSKNDEMILESIKSHDNPIELLFIFSEDDSQILFLHETVFALLKKYYENKSHSNLLTILTYIRKSLLIPLITNTDIELLIKIWGDCKNNKDTMTVADQILTKVTHAKKADINWTDWLSKNKGFDILDSAFHFLLEDGNKNKDEISDARIQITSSCSKNGMPDKYLKYNSVILTMLSTNNWKNTDSALKFAMHFIVIEQIKFNRSKKPSQDILKTWKYIIDNKFQPRVDFVIFEDGFSLFIDDDETRNYIISLLENDKIDAEIKSFAAYSLGNTKIHKKGNSELLIKYIEKESDANKNVRAIFALEKTLNKPPKNDSDIITDISNWKKAISEMPDDAVSDAKKSGL